MRRPIGIVVLLVLTGAFLISCGSNNSSTSSTSSSSTTTAPASRIKNRAFVTNSSPTAGVASGLVNIANVDTDVLSASSISVGPQPGIMAVSPADSSGHRATTLVYNTGNNTVTVINNSTEAVSGNVSMPASCGATDCVRSMVVSSDSKMGYAALPTAITSTSQTGEVEAINLTDLTQAVTRIPVPLARNLALSHSGNKLLAVARDADTVSVIDTTNLTGTPVAVPGFDRPVAAFFSTDDSTAFILNCGPECGGIGASATVMSMRMSDRVITGTLAVDAASVGLLDSSNNLYVAGITGLAGVCAPQSAPCSVLDVVTVSSGTPVATATKAFIAGGLHTVMGLGSDNKLFIGAVNCANSGAGTGCLTIFDVSSHTVTYGGALAKGFVTGIQPIKNRSVMYVVEGGELRVYSTTSSTELLNSTNNPLMDIVGTAVDVKTVDQ